MDPALRELLLRGDAEDEIEAVLRFADGTRTAPAGVVVVARFDAIATCRLKRRDIPRVREAPGVASLKAPRLLGPERPPVAVEPGSVPPGPGDARRPDGLAETGRGVVIGVLDWGLDVAAASFRHADGSTRLLGLWDQRTRRGRRQPNAYGYGWIHSPRAIDAALRSTNPYAALDYDSADSDPLGIGAHGTVVTDLAAGNGRSGLPPGVAPAAGIVFVHLASRDTAGLANLGDSIGILEGLDFLRRVAAGRPLVCSLSVGRHAGPHDGSTLVELGIDAFVTESRGRAVAQSAGNYALRRCHTRGVLTPGTTRAVSLVIDAADPTQNELEVWHECDPCSVELVLPDGSTSGWTPVGAVNDVRRDGRVLARVYHRRSDPQNGSHHVDAFTAPGAPGGTWTMRLRDERRAGAGLTFHAWIERDDACPACQSRFDTHVHDASCTLGTLANGRHTLVCGAYDAHDPARSVAAFSSDGPTRDGRWKPDLLAPGVAVLSLRSRPRMRGHDADRFSRRSGTSMAAPHVAGCAALLLEAGGGALSHSEVRDLVLANVDPIVLQGDLQRPGLGYLDIARAVRAARRYTSPAWARHREGTVVMNPQQTLDDVVRAVEAALSAAVNAPGMAQVVSAWLGGNAPSSLDALYRRLADASRDVAGVAPRVLARPGQRLDVPLRAGDAILRVALGEPGLAHLAVLVDGRLLSRDELAAGRFSAEGDRPGQYAWVIEAGARPHRADARFARRVTDRSGVVPPGQIVLRPPSTLGDDVSESAPGDALLWSDETADAGWPTSMRGVNPGDLASLPLVADYEDVGTASSEAGTLIDPAALASLEPEDVAAPGLDDPMAEGWAEGVAEGWTVAADDAWHAGYDEGAESAPGDPDHGWEAAEAAPSVTTLNMRQGPPPKPRPVRARILWPALGFPAVVTPPATPATSPFEDGDATKCICVLLLSDTELLSKEEAARYLRVVPWNERGRRHIRPGQPGTFREEEIAVRNGGRQGLLSDPRPKDRLGEFVRFGANGNGRNGIVASLGKKVKELYAADGLQYLHEIRIYDTATRRMTHDRYHLFWNNESPDEKAPSDEMAMLVRLHARRERSKLGALWQQKAAELLREYEIEYGALHPPYSATDAARQRRAEILHPLFVRRRDSKLLRVAQLSDTHVDVRNDVYEENLAQSKTPGMRNVPFNNWNKDFVALYRAAKPDADAIMLTGDLIDYGRGHWGPAQRGRVGDDTLYQSDRNWFLFSYLLSRDDEYTHPVYTILGNHDWRLNPYPPFAIAGAPKASAFIHGAQGKETEQQKAILREAHGDGWERTISYTPAIEKHYAIALRNIGTIAGQALRKMFGGEKTMDKPGLPTETNVESVAWYLLAINPFLDYRFALPGGHDVLMLDWAEDESVFLGDIYKGKRYASFDKASGDEGPKARNALTDLQVALVKEFADVPGVAKIIGIHAPPIGPWDDWSDAELADGWRAFDYGGRGYPHYKRTRAGGPPEQGHPLFAIKPAKGLEADAVEGMDASYNSFERHRETFIRIVTNPRHGVRVVLSGHIHRQGLYVAYKAPEAMGSVVAGELLVQAVSESDTRGVRHPAGSLKKVRNSTQDLGVAPGPLFVNATSAGPRGNWLVSKGVSRRRDPGFAHIELSSDGTIQRVDFRQLPASTSRPLQPTPGVAMREVAPALG